MEIKFNSVNSNGDKLDKLKNSLLLESDMFSDKRIFRCLLIYFFVSLFFNLCIHYRSDNIFDINLY